MTPAAAILAHLCVCLKYQMCVCVCCQLLPAGGLVLAGNLGRQLLPGGDAEQLRQLAVGPLAAGPAGSRVVQQHDHRVLSPPPASCHCCWMERKTFG